MSRAIAGPEIERLIQLLAKLPGLGPRSARRAALHLVKKREQLLGPLAEAMATARERIVVCTTCGNIDTSNPCSVCRDARRDDGLIVVVADVSDLWALERSGAVSGRYPVLGGVLSAFVGALCVTPVTALVARQPSGPAALVSFTPAFALLVPGALGLVGVADVLGGDATAAASLVATLSTMVAIALGVLAGSSLSNRMRRPAL